MRSLFLKLCSFLPEFGLKKNGINSSSFLFTSMKKLSTKILLITQYNIDNQFIKQKSLTILKRVSLSEIIGYSGGEQ